MPDADTDAVALLRTEGLSKAFGGVRALDDVSLELRAGEIVGIIGPNGAGKSTLLNCISGAEQPSAGRVLYDGEDVTDLPMHRRARLGVRRTFQLERLVEAMSVIENVMSGAGDQRPYLTVETILGTPRFRRAERDLRRRSLELLGRLGLARLADASPATIPPGQRRLVEIARAYVSDPRVLLLDEPTGGLSPEEADEVFDLVREFRAEGRAIAVIEHRVRTAAELSDRLAVIDRGRLVAWGAPDEVRRSGSVMSAYMGVAATQEAP